MLKAQTQVHVVLCWSTLHHVQQTRLKMMPNLMREAVFSPDMILSVQSDHH